MTDYMDVNDVLEEIHELGFFSYDKTVNHGYPKIIAPKFTVHVDRLALFYKFMLEYIKNNINTPIKCYFTVYDAFREHSEPSESPFFIPASKILLQPYKGHGSANEPGRFIQPYENKDIFPIFNYKVLAFGRHKNDLTTLLIPDTDFIKFNGYEKLREEIDMNDRDWSMKISSIFWRGGIHGKGYYEYDKQSSGSSTPASTSLTQGQKKPRCQRQMLVDYSLLESSESTRCRWLDAKASYTTTKTEMLQYKYQLDIDGEVNAWSALWWKLYSNSVVFKVDSHYEQWYYKDLKEWVHYIPVKADLSDLEEKYKWALENDEKCYEIAMRGKEFASQLTYENVIKNYKIQ